MKRVRLSGFAGLLLSVVAIALAGSAIAYFSASGTGNAAAAVSKLTAPTAVTTCVDGAVPIGEHTYVVTAVWHTLETSGSGKTAKITVGAVASFTVSASATSIVAGGSSNLTITA